MGAGTGRGEAAAVGRRSPTIATERPRISHGHYGVSVHKRSGKTLDTLPDEMMVRRLVTVVLVALVALAPAVTLAAYPHCALQGPDCGSPCASSSTLLPAAPDVVTVAFAVWTLDGAAGAIPPAPIRVADVPPRDLSSAY